MTKFQDTQKILKQWADDGFIVKTNEKNHEYKPKDTWLEANARVVSFNFGKIQPQDLNDCDSQDVLVEPANVVETRTDFHFDDDEDIDALFEDDTTSQAQASQEEIVIEIDEDGADEN